MKTKTKLAISTLIFSSLLVTAPAMAGSDHKHGHDHSHGHGHSHGPLSQDKVKLKAELILKKLVAREKIDKSWSGMKVASAEKKTFKDRQEWVVIFTNPGLEDKAKQTLYMFFKLNGQYLATNYSGK